MLTIEGHPLATRTGLWCARCALPSRLEVDVIVTDASNPLNSFGRFTASECTDCGASDLTR